MRAASYNRRVTLATTPSPVVDPAADATQRRELASSIKRWGRELGFAEVAICDAHASEPASMAAEERLVDWLAKDYHGEMDYMARHGTRRARPAELVPGTLSIISVRMDYLPRGSEDRVEDGEPGNGAWVGQAWRSVGDPTRATISLYAQGRDYHKVLKSRLKKLAARIEAAVGPLGHRVFTDSAPVMEVELARRGGLGWRGKHTLLLSRTGGSMFFLGELFVDMALPADAPVADHCGTCRRCIDVCPTQAIVAPYVLDARRCIAYLTIELPGSIPLEFRPLIGNRVFGCDDCQLVCPWNKFAGRASVADFDTRGLDDATLIELFAWTENEFLTRTEGSAIRRIGHERWLRNLAVGLGNALAAALQDGQRGVDAANEGAMRTALAARIHHPSALVREHVAWALDQKPVRAAHSS